MVSAVVLLVVSLAEEQGAGSGLGQHPAALPVQGAMGAVSAKS